MQNKVSLLLSIMEVFPTLESWAPYKDERAETRGRIWLEEKWVLAVVCVCGGGNTQLEPDAHRQQG